MAHKATEVDNQRIMRKMIEPVLIVILDPETKVRQEVTKQASDMYSELREMGKDSLLKGEVEYILNETKIVSNKGERNKEIRQCLMLLSLEIDKG